MGGAAVMVLRGRRRKFWKSWLALSVLVAVTAGFVLAAIAAGQRTAAAFPASAPGTATTSSSTA